MRNGIQTRIEVSWLIVGLLGVVALISLSGCQTTKPKVSAPPRDTGPIRAVWVTRWDYKSPSDISQIMHNCKRAGFNTVLFQVRGNGTVCYDSRIEPWAKEMGGSDPGFDPLAMACREAHRRGMFLHAWANVMPGWRGKEAPSNPKQLYNARPDWFWHDARGRREPLGWYNSVNPCFPEVRNYLVSVMREIVGRYPVDGLHLDYIRFPNEPHDFYPPGEPVPDYPRDPRTLALFRQATGHTPESNPRAWDDWRNAQVTQLVRQIRAGVKQKNPRVILSAAVGASPEKSRAAHYQDTRTWLAQGLLDAVYPMNYAHSESEFAQRVDYWAGIRSRVPVVMGIMFDKRSGDLVARQIRHTGRTGSHFATFAYNSLFERRSANGQYVYDAQSASRTELRRMMPRFRALSGSGRPSMAARQQ